MAQDYTNMSVQDKLKLADEQLEKLKGTDKYDAFKKRVDAMHKKYDVVRPGVKWDYKFNKPSGSRIGDTREGLEEVLLGKGSLYDDPHIGERVKITLKDGSYVVPSDNSVIYYGNISMPGAFTVYRRDPASPRDKNDVMSEKGYRREVNKMPLDEVYDRMRIFEEYPTLGTSQASKAGQADLTGMSNFLATDKVPDTIFGIPVVSRREDYTEEDIAFFKEHPEAGGYYDMGEGTPEDGTVEGAPVQMDVPVRLGVDVDQVVRETQDHANTADSFIAASKLIKRWEKFESKARQRLRANGTKEDVFTIGEGFTNLIDANGQETPVTGETPDMSGDENQVQLYRHLLKYDDMFRSRFGAKYTSMSPSKRGAMLSVAFNAGPHVYLKGTKKDKKTLLSPRFEAKLARSQNLETALDGNLDYGAEPRRSETARMFKLGVDGPWQDQSLRVRISRAAVEAMSPKGGAMDRDAIIRALSDRVIKRGSKWYGK